VPATQPKKRPSALTGNGLDVTRLTETLDRHDVLYLLVGGLATMSYGAQRQTFDFDCLALRSLANLDRLASAMKELSARLRVEGLSDEESSALLVPLDGQWLASNEITTWRTDAGDFDVLCDMPDRAGNHLSYEDIVDRAEPKAFGNVTVMVASLDDVIASKQWANRPKDNEALPELLALATQLRTDHPES
jgi:hypothetical protein